MLIYDCEGCGKQVVRARGDEGRGRFCSIRCGRLHQPMATREERFWRKVAKGDGCWEWRGHRSTNMGHGILKSGPRGACRQEYAHRVSWELHFGPIPDGLNVCHSCDNPPCVNPAHLWLGTDADNMADRDRKGRHGSIKLTADQVRAIRVRRAAGELTRPLAKAFGVSQSYVSMLSRGRARKHVV